MRMGASNSVGKPKLKYDDIYDLVLSKEMHNKDSGKTSYLGSSLNIDSRGRSHDRDSNKGR